MKSEVLPKGIGFSDLRLRLREHVNGRVRNGEFTERGLARLIGASQPQLHNFLKGVRNLSVDSADALLRELGLSLVDLLTAEERSQAPFCPSLATPRKPPTWNTSRTGYPFSSKVG